MNRKINLVQINNLFKRGYFSYLTALMAVIILPIHVKYLPPFMILWSIFWILENFVQTKSFWNTRTEYKVLFILFVSYYIWQVISLIYTADVKMGLLNLFGRLSLILFPLVLFSPGEMIKNKVRILIRSFALSTLLFIFYCFVYASFKSISVHNGIWTFNPHPAGYPWLNFFYGSDLTLAQHPTYIAIYVLFSTFICFESWFDNSLKLNHRTCWLIIGLMLLLTQYFLSSRAGILISLLLVPSYFIYKFYILRKKKLSILWIVLVVIAFVPVVIKNQRMDYFLGRLLKKQVGYERKKDPRFLIWESALKIAQQNILFGVGIGDVRNELVQEYIQIGEEKMAEERLNAHNQFLEVLLENGLIGLSLFVAILGLVTYITFVDKNLLYGLFILMMVIFFLSETVLYRLAGVSFFSLFTFLLLYVNQRK